MREFVELWLRWWSGEVVADEQLWGLSVNWWGRIGKITGFFAGTIVILDIIGEQRLQRFSSRLSTGPLSLGQARTRIDRLAERASDSMEQTRVAQRRAGSRKARGPQYDSDENKRGRLDELETFDGGPGCLYSLFEITVSLLAIGLGAWGLSSIIGENFVLSILGCIGLVVLLAFGLFMGLSGVSIPALIGLGVTLLPVLVGVAIQTLLIKPIASLLGQDRLMWIRVLSFVLLLVSFQFDLLAS